MIMYYQRFAFMVILLTSLFATGLSQQEEQPVLKLETGMHTAAAKGLSTDARGRYLLSCSDDKVARLWEAATGRLLNILRIPISEGDDGELYACALSPDSKMAVVGGWTEDGEDLCIYVLNPFTGQLIRKLDKLPEVINRLEFSKDGQWLAAGLGGKGVVIYNTHNWKEIRLDKNYLGKVHGLNFDQHNNLATVCYDGYLRIYSGPEFLLKSQVMLSAQRPYSVAFNPTGNLLAVGYDQIPNVEILYTKNLQVAYRPDVRGVPFDQDLAVVSFSPDGNTLYAGGAFHMQNNGTNKYVIRKWDNAGRGNYLDHFCLANAVRGIIPLANGTMAMIGAYPDLAVVDPVSFSGWYNVAENVDFTNISEFVTSYDERTVGVKSYYGMALFFNITNRSITEDNSLLYPPRTQNGSLRLNAWKRPDPSANGSPLRFFLPNETCRSACVHPEEPTVVWGADFNLYLTDETGQVKWKTPLPEAAFAVNISGKGKVVVAALGDGTIRWYDIKDGKELLAFYSSIDRRHWVLFSPKGYYDASAGAENLLGWHINHGRDKTPAFYPVSRFKDNYYRPDIIDAIAENWGGEDQAVELANNKTGKIEQTISGSQLPPTVVIHDPYTDTTFSGDVVQVTFTVETPPGSTVSRPEIRVDSRPVQVEMNREIKPLNNQPITARVNVQQKDCTISITARNEFGTSPEAKVYLKYDSSANPAPKNQRKPKLFIVAIGISDYNKSAYKLNYAADDARSFVDAFMKQKGRMYENVEYKLLLNKDATKEEIERAFAWIESRGTREDMCMIFFAGHGINNNNGSFYIGAVGADFEDLKVTCINSSELTETVKNILGQVVVFIDACHSGNVTGGSRFLTDISRAASEWGNEQNGAVVFTSSLSKERSQESSAWRHGAFTAALLEGMKGETGIPKADSTKISFKSLDLYITRKVKELTNDSQHPNTVVPPNTPDFDIAELYK